MATQQLQRTFSDGHPNFGHPEIEKENYHLRFRFEYGHLDDGSLWIRTPSKSLFHIDWLTLRLLLELNAGMPFIPLCRKYKVNLNEMRALLTNMKKEGAIVSPREGKITQATQQDDIHIAPFVFLFILLAVIQIEYFQNIAVTYRLRNWHATLLIGIFSILPIILHELGHYFSSKPYFPPRLGFTFLWFFPAVYIDTHASWCLPRNIRLLINSSGLLMDLGFNTLLVILVIYFPRMEYYVTPLLVLQYTRWSIIMNPLVNGDGYWLLSDFSRTVNLRRKAKAYFRNSRFHWLSLYGFLSALFSVFSILGLIWFILNLFRFGILFK
jgi:hypothetical protein